MCVVSTPPSTSFASSSCFCSFATTNCMCMCCRVLFEQIWEQWIKRETCFSVIVWFWNFIFNICTDDNHRLLCAPCVFESGIRFKECPWVCQFAYMCLECRACVFKTIDKPSDWRSPWRAAATSICDPFYSRRQPDVALPERRAAIFHHTTSVSISSCGRTACSGNCAITSGRSPTRVATKGITLMV